MEKVCEHCQRGYEARRKDSRYCGDTCRSRASLERTSGVVKAPVVPLPSAAPDPATPSPPVGVVASIEKRLAAFDRLDTVHGQRALFLADRMTREFSGSAVAALSKELTVVLELALEGVAQAADPLDELKAKRDRLRTG